MVQTANRRVPRATSLLERPSLRRGLILLFWVVIAGLLVARVALFDEINFNGAEAAPTSVAATNGASPGR
jgi:hypothetical protein